MSRITKEELLAYLYKEASEEKRTAILAALSKNWELAEELQQFQDIKTELETVTYSPSKNTLANIIEYAEKSKKVQQIGQD